jgi:ATP phosphoribosyltransferase regulatory subunit
MTKRPYISLPEGVRDILPEEALKITSIERAVTSAFEAKGFKRIVTPLLEYVETLSQGLSSELRDSLIKFIEPSTGKVMAVRPDITPQIARVVATKMRDYPLPLRIYYNENVLRVAEGSEGKSTEILQAGAEIISKEATAEVDAEVLTLAIESLKAAGVKDFKVDIGDVGFIRSILNGLNISQGESEKIQKAIGIKDKTGLEKIIETLGENKVNSDDKTLLLELTTFYGEDEVIDKALKLISSRGDSEAKDKLQHLSKVVELIKDSGLSEFITVDLGEVRGFDYYTGIIFEGFAKGYGKPLLGGGRYDTLLEKYGSTGKSTGFALDVENIVAALNNKKA